MRGAELETSAVTVEPLVCARNMKTQECAERRKVDVGCLSCQLHCELHATRDLVCLISESSAHKHLVVN